MVLVGIDSDDPDEVVRSLVQIRKEKGWSLRLFSLHSLRGSEGLYEEWCKRMSNDVRRLKIASSGVSLPQKDESTDVWAKTVPGQFDDAQLALPFHMNFVLVDFSPLVFYSCFYFFLAISSN